MNAVTSRCQTWAKTILTGLAEIVFQDTWITGALFLLGLFIASPWMAVGGLLGSSIGTATAFLLKYDETDWKAGIHGFNPALVGIAMCFHFVPGVTMIVALVVGSILATLLNAAMRKLPFPTYTAPFIVVTWVLFAVGAQLGLAVEVSSSERVVYNSHTVVRILEESFAGLAEIMLGANVWTGVLFLTGITVGNWRHGVIAFMGSLLGTLIGHYHADPDNLITIGIYGYNSALAAVALYLWRPSILMSMFGAILAAPVCEFFPDTTLPTLTAPFVLTCWFIIAVGQLEPYFNLRPNPT